MVRLVEDRYGYHKEIVLECFDSEGQIEKLLNHIMDTANTGHSFTVVCDPGDKERETKFYIDGDGSDRITNISSTVIDDEED